MNVVRRIVAMGADEMGRMKKPNVTRRRKPNIHVKKEKKKCVSDVFGGRGRGEVVTGVVAVVVTVTVVVVAERHGSQHLSGLCSTSLSDGFGTETVPKLKLKWNQDRSQVRSNNDAAKTVFSKYNFILRNPRPCF